MLWSASTHSSETIIPGGRCCSACVSGERWPAQVSTSLCQGYRSQHCVTLHITTLEHMLRNSGTLGERDMPRWSSAALQGQKAVGGGVVCASLMCLPLPNADALPPPVSCRTSTGSWRRRWWWRARQVAPPTPARSPQTRPPPRTSAARQTMRAARTSASFSLGTWLQLLSAYLLGHTEALRAANLTTNSWGARVSSPACRPLLGQL